MKKRAIVLLVTLGFITVISVLVLRTVTLSKNSLDDLLSLKSQNQMMLLMKDFTKIVDKFSPQDFKDNFVDSGEFPISDEKSGLTLSISCISFEKRLNLNKLLRCKKPLCKNFKESFSDYFELSSTDTFWQMLEYVSNPKNENTNAMPNSYIQRGKVVSFVSIEKVKDEYFKQVRDKNIYKITKEKLYDVFYLSDTNITDTKDVEPTKTIQKILNCYDEECKNSFNNIKKSLNNETNTTRRDDNKTIQTKDLIQCTIDNYVGDITHSVVFKYNLKQKRVHSIDEFY